jgi:branched-chain amino acid aminotransferase
MKVWLDGKLVDTDSASVNVYDHGLLYGDGVFEGLRAYHGRIFRLQAHIDRLFDGAKAIRLTIPQTKQEMVDALYETLKANNLSDAYIRLVVTRGIGTLGLNPFKCKRSQVIIIVDQIDLYPREMYEKGMSVIIASTVRTAPNALNPRIKSLNYLNNIMARVEAVDAGVPEAIMLNAQGLVAEATGDNVFLVRDGKLLTPPIHAGILEGITRAAVMELAGQAGVPMAEADLSRYDLYTAHECFLTGTAAEVVPVTRIDGRQIGDGAVGPLTRQPKASSRANVPPAAMIR